MDVLYCRVFFGNVFTEQRVYASQYNEHTFRHHTLLKHSLKSSLCIIWMCINIIHCHFGGVISVLHNVCNDPIVFMQHRFSIFLNTHFPCLNDKNMTTLPAMNCPGHKEVTTYNLSWSLPLTPYCDWLLYFHTKVKLHNKRNGL